MRPRDNLAVPKIKEAIDFSFFSTGYSKLPFHPGIDQYGPRVEVLGYVSDGEVRRPSGGLKLALRDFLGLEIFWWTFYGSENFGRTFFSFDEKLAYLRILNFMSNNYICSVLRVCQVNHE